MANGNHTFDELREIVQEEREINTKAALRLIMAGLADVHDARTIDMKGINEKLDCLDKKLSSVQGVTKYPSFLWYLVNMPLKTLAVVALLALIASYIFVPGTRDWVAEHILKTILGGL